MEEKIIGRIMATEKNPTTIDSFTFWTRQDEILNPFDVIKVEHIEGSMTFGQIESISHITDAPSFLSNFISSDFGELDIEDQTFRVGMNYITARVLCNDKNIDIPVQNNSKVMLANKTDIEISLGLNTIRDKISCGYMEMYDKNKNTKKIMIPVNLSSKFILGPEGAHLNISGISGLASKTSYAMFLFKSIQEYYKNINKDNDSIAYVIFNVKGKDLLGLHKENSFDDVPENSREKERELTYNMYETLGIEPRPFENVKYLLPYGIANQWNTYLEHEDVEVYKDNEIAKFYKYIFEDDKENLDLLFSNIDDSNQTIESILTYILQEEGEFSNINNWNDFLDKIKEKTQSGQNRRSGNNEIMVQSWRRFSRLVNNFIKSDCMFANSVNTNDSEIRLSDELKNIKPNDMIVVDIAKLSEEKQSFVFGDAIRTLYNLRLGVYSEEKIIPPKRIVVFIDELNKYASPNFKNSPILRQLLDITERGRSLGIILFGAEQFRSAIEKRITGNCSTHAYGRTNTVEVADKNYGSINSVYKSILTKLNQGEYIIQNPLFNSLLKIKFPKPLYKQFK